MKTYSHFIFIVFWALVLPTDILFAQEKVLFVNHRGIELEARIEKETGSVSRIYGIREPINLHGIFKDQLNSARISELGVSIVNAYSEQLKITGQNISLQKLETDGSWWFADFQQQVQGIPVKHTEIGFTIDPRGNIVTLGARAFPDIKEIPSPRLSSDEATRTAQAKFDDQRAEVISDPVLVILPISKESKYAYFLTWEITLRSLEPVKNITYFVDALNGEIIREVDNIMQNVLHNSRTIFSQRKHNILQLQEIIGLKALMTTPPVVASFPG